MEVQWIVIIALGSLIVGIPLIIGLYYLCRSICSRRRARAQGNAAHAVPVNVNVPASQSIASYDRSAGDLSAKTTRGLSANFPHPGHTTPILPYVSRLNMAETDSSSYMASETSEYDTSDTEKQRLYPLPSKRLSFPHVQPSTGPRRSSILGNSKLRAGGEAEDNTLAQSDEQSVEPESKIGAHRTKTHLPPSHDRPSVPSSSAKKASKKGSRKAAARKQKTSTQNQPLSLSDDDEAIPIDNPTPMYVIEEQKPVIEPIPATPVFGYNVSPITVSYHPLSRPTPPQMMTASQAMGPAGGEVPLRASSKQSKKTIQSPYQSLRRANSGTSTPPKISISPLVSQKIVDSGQLHSPSPQNDFFEADQFPPPDTSPLEPIPPESLSYGNPFIRRVQEGAEYDATLPSSPSQMPPRKPRRKKT